MEKRFYCFISNTNPGRSLGLYTSSLSRKQHVPHIVKYVYDGLRYIFCDQYISVEIGVMNKVFPFTHSPTNKKVEIFRIQCYIL